MRALPLLLLLLVQVLVCTQQGDGHAVHRADRVRRRLSWANWSVFDRLPGYARKSKEAEQDDFYRNGIFFKVFTKQNPDEPEIMDIYDFDKPKLRYFDPQRPTKIVTHGWLSDGIGVHHIKDAFLDTMDVNVILVNWTNIDTIFYPAARWHVPLIGERVGYLLDFLRLVYEVPASSLHLIGHSLGAHISGMAGSLTQWGTVGRITGLDPAGPMFPTNPKERLDRHDATFVDVIHTCANVLGFNDPIGHVDFFPNGGTCIQPGCTFLDMTQGTCSHNRAFDFLVESIEKTNSFKGYPCTAKRKPDLSDPTKAVTMGLAAPTNANGTYCLTTKDRYPFAMDDEEQRHALRHNVGSSGDSGDSGSYEDNEVQGEEEAERDRTILQRFMRQGQDPRRLGRDMPDY